MKLKAALLILLTILFSIPGTAFAAEEKKTDNWAEYFPLKKNSHWKYIYKSTHNGNPIETLKRFYRVSGWEEIKGSDCAVYEMVIRNKPVVTKFLEVSENGITIHRSNIINEIEHSDMTPPFPMLKFPLKKGKTWKWEGKSGREQWKFVVMIKGEEEIKVPAGKFKTFRIEQKGIRSDGKAFKVTRWYSRGVGLVKEHYSHNSDDGHLEYFMTLTNYGINTENAGSN